MPTRLTWRLQGLQIRCLATSSHRHVRATLPSRWLSDIKSRIGKCLNFGLRSAQADEAGSLLRVLVKDWRELLAGSEGFLVSKDRAGLERHQVVWGEMVGWLPRWGRVQVASNIESGR